MGVLWKTAHLCVVYVSEMSRLERNKKNLKRLANLPRKQRNKLLQKINKDCIDCLRDCCLNILEGRIPLKPKNKEQLRKYKTKIRAAANKKIGSSKVRRSFQFGGFFQALIPVLASLIGPIISNFIE